MRNRSVIAVVMCILGMQAAAIDVSSRYRSPRNPERSIRKSTELIVLHTTEAPARSSLNKVSDRGECHFVVTEEGSVYRIVDRDREAFHAGRSMWRGKEDVDKFSIGIECVGYHDKAMGMVQLKAIRDLVKELQSMYRISDDRVICHSHVAYGAPNRWHRCKHRGRKRCGMLFAMPSVRRILDLKSRPGRDEDVRAGRLRNADPYLARVLYGSTDTMRKAYPAAATPAVRQKGTASARPQGTPGARPQGTSGAHQQGGVPRSVAELKAGGWRAVGVISPSQTALKLAGDRWNAPNTYYTIRDKVISGAKVDPAHFEKGMTVWTRK